MGFSWLFFSFQGRVNRGIWWAVAVGLTFIGAAIAFVTYDQVDQSFANIASLVLFALQIGPDVKRLHDRNKSGHWLWLYYGVPNALIALALMTADSAVTAAAVLIGLGFVAWIVIDLGILVGTQGDNRFGADPLAKHPARPRGST